MLQTEVFLTEHVDDNRWDLFFLSVSSCDIYREKGRRGDEETYHEETVDLKVLDGLQKRRHLELGQHHGLVTSVCSNMADNYQGEDVALREKT